MFAATKPKPASPPRSETLIGAGTVLAGDIVFSGGLRIDGEVRGNVRALDDGSGTLVIGEQSRVASDVDAARVIVNGAVTGRGDAREFIRLQSKARINCNVVYAQAEIHRGAVVCGQLLQRPAAAPEAAAAGESANPQE